MSVKAMTRVWDHHEWAQDPETFDKPVRPSTLKFVLLAIADHADHHGGNAWPSIDTLAEMTELTPRAVQLAVRRLDELGKVRVELQEGGSREIVSPRQRPNLYTVLVDPSPRRPSVDEDGPESGVNHVHPAERADDEPGVNALHPTGVHHVHPDDGIRGERVVNPGCTTFTQTVLDPSNEPPTPRSGEPISPRAAGTNPRAQGTNPRASGSNPRGSGSNPRALGSSPRDDELARQVAADRARADRNRQLLDEQARALAEAGGPADPRPYLERIRRRRDVDDQRRTA